MHCDHAVCPSTSSVVMAEYLQEGSCRAIIARCSQQCMDAGAFRGTYQNRLHPSQNADIQPRRATRPHHATPGPRRQQNSSGPRTLWPTAPTVVFDNVSLAYGTCIDPGTLRAVVLAFSLTLPPNTRVGVVGRTGAGKSTVLRALTGLMEPVVGSVSD